MQADNCQLDGQKAVCLLTQADSVTGACMILESSRRSANELVSVIVPTWNRAEFIAETIDSVLRQTHADLELLICDDGSTDETEAIVRAIDDPRIRWLSGPRTGRPAPPRNRGLQESKGTYVAFLDSDDQWEASKLAIQLRAMGNLGVYAACCNAYRVVNGAPTGEEFVYWNRPLVTFRDLLPGNIMICSSVVLRRELAVAAGGFPEQVEFTTGEDYAYWMRIAALSNIAFCPQRLVKYRDDPVHSIRGKQLSILAGRRKVAADFERWMLERDPASPYLGFTAKWYWYGLTNPTAIAVNAFRKLRRIYFE